MLFLFLKKYVPFYFSIQTFIVHFDKFVHIEASEKPWRLLRVVSNCKVFSHYMHCDFDAADLLTAEPVSSLLLLYYRASISLC